MKKEDKALLIDSLVELLFLSCESLEDEFSLLPKLWIAILTFINNCLRKLSHEKTINSKSTTMLCSTSDKTTKNVSSSFV